MDPTQTVKTTMKANISVFKEPRGVMRILQLIFALWAFATVTDFSNSVEIVVNCPLRNNTEEIKFSVLYPFKLYDQDKSIPDCGRYYLTVDVSSDAQFFVATGVLSFLYCIAIGVVYIMFDSLYQSNGLLPLGDFMLTVVLAVFWLSGSAAWANGLNSLKAATDPSLVAATADCKLPEHQCKVTTGEYSSLTISVVLGFLNFFLWASDLWFLYKETPWFKLKQSSSSADANA